MPFIYSQSTGNMVHNGKVIGVGYAGAPGHVNVAADEQLHQKGPLPKGWYQIGPAHTEPHLGPVAMRLYPAHENVMFGRSDFFIHADAPAHPGAASEGCIVMPQGAREIMALSNDRDLMVIG